MKLSRAIYLLFLLGVSSHSYAWSNYFRFINNFNQPISISFDPDLGEVKNLCSEKSSVAVVDSHKHSCEYEFTTEQKNWYEAPANNGLITITLVNDPSSYCTYTYDYKFNPFSNYFNTRSENFDFQACHGNLKANQFSVVNDKTQLYPRPLAANIILVIDKSKPLKATESLSQADCGGEGGNNCLIVSPDLNTPYVANGSTLSQSLTLQTELDQNLPLNFAQFIGSHNSAISRLYTSSTQPFNLSYSDPNHFLSITDQLNAGVRQLELDIQWHNNDIEICHDNAKYDPDKVICDGNIKLRSSLEEIKAWLQKNPNAVIILYLDVHAPLTGHLNDLDQQLAILDSYIFTPAMATEYFQVRNRTLPAAKLSKKDLISKYNKNIIVTNDDDISNLQTSRYIFTKTENSDSTPLHEIGVDVLYSMNQSCNSPQKYTLIKQAYFSDPQHYNILRLNGDRTILSYIVNVNNKDPDQYNNYFTVKNIPNFLMCPINIYSTTMLGYTCDGTDCNQHPSDPRFYSFLWSWELGYPLQNDTSSSIAYINLKTGHFENEVLMKTPSNTYSVLCAKQSSLRAVPTIAMDWYLTEIPSDNQAIASNAQQACEHTGGKFIAPSVSYWLHDALQMINTAPYKSDKVIINYQKINGRWIA